MMIYELICGKVCHAICHMIFDDVGGQAQMLPEKTDKFFFIMRGKKVEVEFDACSFLIKIENKNKRWFNYTNYDTTDDIANDIIVATEILMEI